MLTIMNRWASRVDNAHGEIRDGLRQLGYPVWDCARHGDGFPDLLVGYLGKFILLEIKSPGEDLNDRERNFHSIFDGYPVYVIQILDDAIAVINAPLD